MIFATLGASALIFAAGIRLAARRLGTQFNPFGVIFAVFELQIGIYLLEPFATRPVPGSDPSLLMAVVLLGSSLSMVVGLWLGTTGERSKKTISTQIRLPIAAIVVITSVVSLATLMDLVAVNGGAPLFLIGESFSNARGASYSDFYTQTFLYGLGVARIAPIAIAMDYIGSGKKFKDHIKGNWYWYAASTLTSGLMVLGGQRNCLIWPFVVWIFAYCLIEKRTRAMRWLIITNLLILSAFFVIVGNFRLGSAELASQALASYFRQEIPDNPVTRFLVWPVIYLGPSLYNLNAALLSGFEPTSGAGLLRKLLPDSMLSGEIAESQLIVEFLADEDLMPMFGQTFRTCMADLYGEFGLVGATLGPGLIILMLALAYSNANRSAIAASIYLSGLPGLLMMPFLDFFSGSSNILPIIAAIGLGAVAGNIRGQQSIRKKPNSRGEVATKVFENPSSVF